MDLPESKWIKFILVLPELREKRITEVYWIRSKFDESYLGEIKWYASWRKYSFFPNDNCVFERQCLTDIIAMIDHLTTERAKTREGLKDVLRQHKQKKADKKNGFIIN